MRGKFFGKLFFNLKNPDLNKAAAIIVHVFIVAIITLDFFKLHSLNVVFTSCEASSPSGFPTAGSRRVRVHSREPIWRVRENHQLSKASLSGS